jgi:hypothetical protein
VPAGPAALVTPASSDPIGFTPVAFRGLSSGGARRGAGEVKELFFPLPYNDEQVTIVQQLERAPGVTVQGPPGTGKTHTIANIVCHYLATGRRVLVTSAGEPALRVLTAARCRRAPVMVSGVPERESARRDVLAAGQTPPPTRAEPC